MNTYQPDSETLVDIYRKMTLIKQSDDRVIGAMKAGRMRMPYYSARGQECIPAAISVLLTDEDYLVTIYRGVHDMLAKGLPAKLLWAELAGKATGSCKGKGGPMHLTYPSKGCMVTTGIVGSSMPIACGLGLASQLRGEKRVTIANFGDGASNIGAFHESLNLAAVWKLPVIFVCQNNQYAEHTSYSKGTSVAKISDRAVSYCIPGLHVDGNDPIAMYSAAKTAIERARSGEGPTLIEAMTFRFNGHLIGDMGEYIPKAEYAAAVAADPYPKYRSWLLETKQASEADLDAIDLAIRAEIDEAEAFAMSSPPPDAIEVKRDVYAYEIA
ncbi:MAG: pyruvate dehydrogenase [Hydrocarboniphaga sp.]|uniref:thiamine pyrophosphate-dependent dehydrogenase E1 component subunit alpha n=1 Tax=Hydrocarboniphaga sp. TaxID=2033016 RepID=UPI0026245919|nr:thiamine pyrophosphate-dependent dehydrogenase E1 component subunit alpha [Hydrocarboniphaga sp.]MDB5967848.1 pyruvate dehydrogenase [Hydrocarboniphaga sp.]